MFGPIKNAFGEVLDYTYHAGHPGRQDIVVLGHGVTGNKDRPFVVALADGLAAAGVSALRFSFSGNGASGGRFVDSTISKEVDDLSSILDALTGWNVTYIGHSMGGAVGVLAASRDTRIKRLVSLAGMVHTKAFAEREFGAVVPDQGCMWDEPTCPLSSAYMNDLRSLNTLEPLGAKIRIPWLLVHGTEDDVVPIQDSRDVLAQAGKGMAEFVELPGSNHVFAGEHMPRMVSLVVRWVVGGNGS